MYNAVLYIEYLNVSPFFTMVIQIVIGTILFTILAVFYCIKVKGINVRNKILYELKNKCIIDEIISRVKNSRGRYRLRWFINCHFVITAS